MTRDADVPQIVEEARVSGWSWLTAECRGCRRRGEVGLAELGSATRLATVGRSLVCRTCHRRNARVSLGASIPIDGVRSIPDRRRIAFDGERVVRPVWD